MKLRKWFLYTAEKDASEKATAENPPLKIHNWISTAENPPLKIHNWNSTAENPLLKIRRWKSASENLPLKIHRWKSTAENSPLKIHRWKSAAEIEHPRPIFLTFEKKFWYLEEFFLCLENWINNNLKSFY